MTEPLTVCCFLWHDPQAKNAAIYTYTVDHVRVLRRMVARHLAQPHRFVCVTDLPGIPATMDEPAVATVPIDWCHHVPGARFVKLQLFRPDGGGIALPGARILYLDLDTVITGALDPLVDDDAPLRLWRNPNFKPGNRRAFYNTSILFLEAGVRPDIWAKFDKTSSPAMLAQKVGGTDQAWVSHRVDDTCPHWTNADGIYGAGRLLDIVPGVQTTLPANARIVFFPGRREPSMPAIQELHPWIQDHRR
jgi:hypothetical protein